MRTVLGLGWDLLRGGRRQGMLGTALVVAAVAVSTALLMFTVSAYTAFLQRADREAWRVPVEAEPAAAAAVAAVAVDQVRDRPLTIVDLAAEDPASAPVPPTLPRFPDPGELWVSPALARLMAELPDDELAGRFGAEPAGLIGDAALVHAEELVAVVGREPGDPAMTAPREGFQHTSTDPTPIADFTGRASDTAFGYVVLAGIAGVLMAVPLLIFGGAAARLTVARRDERLAALRLIGATPAQVTGLTVAESVLTGLAGAVAGLALYALAAPALTRIPIAGGTWYLADLWPGAAVTAGVLAAVPVLVGLSALVGLRRVVVSPLGVARRVTPPAMRAVRLLALVAAVIAFLVGTQVAVGWGGFGYAVLLVLLGFAFLSVNFAGPWVVGVLGRITAAAARRPSTLLAGRRLVDDPRSAWRTVSGIALTGFVAGFTVLVNPGADFFEQGAADRLELLVRADDGGRLEREVAGRLAGIDGAEVATADTPNAPEGYRTVAATVPGGAAALDRARTALAGAAPGQVAWTPADRDRAGAVLLGDIQTGTIVVLSASFLIAVVSAGITGASGVLDRRRTYAQLRLAGTPLEVLDRARRAETLIPLAVMGGGSLLVGLVLASPFALVGALNPVGLTILGATVAAGVAGVTGAAALSRPLLRAVTAGPSPRPD
ncbi:FtsX-like permease family protein [Allonocardiopsis opalescens]|uniref:ABC3 transporter permease C-terminal domain-containing protein n=1 Tax=Allonocardiopsis opalescens TaxID=1144618 RepID=A0A2T0PXK0_9ACTN|nr:FtsX-like permease family protein [Allonocardiopsis opalescens]PRX96265.1 hypothetical protein CLV72_108272 [Allonocardiopsis opalescens]